MATAFLDAGHAGLLDRLASCWPDIGWHRGRLARGAFHDVVIVDGEAAARVSRTMVAAEALEDRSALLSRLAALPLDCGAPEVLSPVVRWDARTAAVLLSVIPGDRHAAEAPTGDALAELRRVRTAIAAAAPALDADNLRSWCGGPNLRRIIADQVAPLMGRHDRPAALAAVDLMLRAEAKAPVAAIHGDLTSFNLHWMDDRVVGVVDWDAACLGDPAIDVAGLLATFGRDVAAQVADDETLRRASLHRATFPLQVAAAGALHNDENLLRTGIANFTARRADGTLLWPRG